MNRTAAALSVAIVVLVETGCVSSARSETLADRFVVSSPESPRGSAIDIDDPSSIARLLAYYGEPARAYEILRAQSGWESHDPRTDRFRSRLLSELGRYEGADSLLALQPHTRDRREYYLHYLRRARLNALSGHEDRVLDFVGRLDGMPYEEFDPYKDFLAVEALLRSGRPQEAVDLAQKRLSAGIPRSLTPSFERATLKSFLGAGRPDEALAFLDTLKSRVSRKTLLAPVISDEAEIRFAVGDTLGAIRAATEFIRTYGAAKAAEPVQAVIARVDPAILENAAILEFVGVFVTHNRPSDAEKLLAVLDERALQGSEKEKSRILRSETCYQAGRYAAALGAAEPLFADPTLERRAKLLRARAYRGTGEKKRSAAAYEAFAAAYPYDTKAPEALFVAWDMYREEGDAKAGGLLDRIVKTYPNHKYAHLATRRIALDHVERREYSTAARVLGDALDRWGREDEALLYYLAVAHGKLGREEQQKKLLGEIAAVDPFSFYMDPRVSDDFVLPVVTAAEMDTAAGSAALRGFLECVFARREWARDRVRHELPPWRSEDVFDEAGAYLNRGRVFLEMGFRDWAEVELRVFESWEGLPARAQLELAAVYEDFALPGRGARAVQRVRDSLDESGRRRLDGHFKLLTYPTPFPFMVTANCIRFRMSPHLVYAMIREESRFDEGAVSGAGARGLMQVMPRTGEQIAGELGLPRDPARSLFSPEFNLTVGVSYASDLLGKSKGDPLMMLAAYNAGFSNAKRWFAGAQSSSSPIERVDDIDYWETCDYVKKIVESAHIYHELYFSPRSAANCE